MFDELHQYLGWTTNFPQSDLVLIDSMGPDTGFLIHHFMSCFMKQNLPVCLVTVSQTFFHYAQAGAKVGVNLEKALQAGTMHHYDLMSELLDHYLQPKEIGGDATNHLYLNLKKEMSSLMRSSTNALLVIDDLSVLSAFKTSSLKVDSLLHYLRTLAKLMGFNIVIAIPPVPENLGKSLQHLASHYADTVLRVKSLKTGYSKDVHGQLEVVKGVELHNSVRQYKLTDKSLHLFAKGTSTAVL